MEHYDAQNTALSQYISNLSNREKYSALRLNTHTHTQLKISFTVNLSLICEYILNMLSFAISFYLLLFYTH